MNFFDYLLHDKGSINKDFILNDKDKLSYAGLIINALSLSHEIRQKFGQDKNILLISHNNSFFVTAYLAIIKSGNVCVPLNPETEKSNLEFIISITKPEAVFISKGLIAKHSMDNHLAILTEDEVGKESNDFSFVPDADFDPERTAEIIFTSGSTGEPKGVELSHKNLIANTRSIVEYLKLTTDDTVLVVMPFYYCYGLSLLHTHLKAGGSIVLNNMFMFIGTVLSDLQKYRCTGFAGVPSHFQILLRKSTDFQKTNFPYLKYVTQAGGKLHTVFMDEFINTFPNILFYVMYGQTEATARLSYLPPEMLKDKLGSIGRGIPGTELMVVNEKGDKTAPGVVGELLAKGDNVMKGYYKDPKQSDEVLKNGWLYTGDLAKYDKDGYIYLEARKKEILKIRGRRLSPKEIEEVIVALPEVVDCTIEAVNDDIQGEAIKAIIVVQDINTTTLTPETIKSVCAKSLASYKVPSWVEFRSKMVISASGKKVKTKENTTN